MSKFPLNLIQFTINFRAIFINLRIFNSQLVGWEIKNCLLLWKILLSQITFDSWILYLLFTTSWLQTQVLKDMSSLKHSPTHLLSTHLDMWLNSSFPSVYPETVSYFKGQNGKSYILFLSRFYKLFFFYLCPQDIIKYKNKQSEFLSCRESQQGRWRVWGVGMSVCTGWREASQEGSCTDPLWTYKTGIIF